MTREALLLTGRDTAEGRAVLETHAERIRRRELVDAVHVATYGPDPRDELRAVCRDLAADRTYAVPMAMAHTRETTEAVPGALSLVDGEVHYGEPPGRDPGLTGALLERATDRLPASPEASLVLVGFGNGSAPYHRQSVEYHATRLAARSAYDSVLSCYLLQNPAVECVRYNVPTEAAVAVPAFVLPGPATAERIPSALELDRGGVACAEPLGEHPRVTDAVESELARLRVLADSRVAPASFEQSLVDATRPVATDGEGP